MRELRPTERAVSGHAVQFWERESYLLDSVTDLAFVPDDGTGEEAKIVGVTFRSPNKLPVTFTPIA